MGENISSVLQTGHWGPRYQIAVAREMGSAYLSFGRSADRSTRGAKSPNSNQEEEIDMSFSLPELPYAYDALQPYMSAETLEYHHDKHHQTYVTTGKQAAWRVGIRGQEPRGDRGKGALWRQPGAVQQCRSAFQPPGISGTWMKPDGGGAIPGALEKKITEDLGGVDKMEGRFHPGRRDAVRLWLGLDRGEERQKLEIIEGRANGESPLVHWRQANSRRRCLGAFPTISTTAIAGPTISRPSSTIS